MALYSQRLYWHVRKMVGSHQDAHDVLQNVWVKAWFSIKSFREEARLYTWLYRIATNETLTYLKQRQSAAPQSSLQEVGEQVRRKAADQDMEGERVQALLQEAIARLPQKQRLVFNMRYYDNIKYQDMAQILQTSEGALKASYHHAVAKVEAYLKEHA